VLPTLQMLMGINISQRCGSREMQTNRDRGLSIKIIKPTRVKSTEMYIHFLLVQH
jgi:hypothetical protein